MATVTSTKDLLSTSSAFPYITFCALYFFTLVLRDKIQVSSYRKRSARMMHSCQTYTIIPVRRSVILGEAGCQCLWMLALAVYFMTIIYYRQIFKAMHPVLTLHIQMTLFAKILTQLFIFHHMSQHIFKLVEMYITKL